MSHENTSENYNVTVEETDDLPVIKMNSSEFFLIPTVPVLLRKSYRLVPNRIIKLRTSFPLDRPASRILKRSVDIFISSIAIITVLSWLIPILALLIKSDSKGPVFFFQKRAGKNGRLFTCIKLRSMQVNPQADIKPAIENDERITKLGRFLRMHYLDELPQFFNVWMGDMSLIGPRPHMISDNLKYEAAISYYDLRHRVKPGITGLAQSLGFSGPMDDIQKAKNRVRLDIYYIRRWSVRLDFAILFRTFRKITGT